MVFVKKQFINNDGNKKRDNPHQKRGENSDDISEYQLSSVSHKVIDNAFDTAFRRTLHINLSVYFAHYSTSTGKILFLCRALPRYFHTIWQSIKYFVYFPIMIRK